MKLTDITKQIKAEPAIHGESTVQVPHWDFEVNGEKYHAFPHYSGYRLIVGKTGPDGRFYTISRDCQDLGSLEWHENGSYTRHSIPHTDASRWLTEINYTDDNALWNMLGTGRIYDPINDERPDNTPWMKGDDQPE